MCIIVGWLKKNPPEIQISHKKMCAYGERREWKGFANTITRAWNKRHKPETVFFLQNSQHAEIVYHKLFGGFNGGPIYTRGWRSKLTVTAPVATPVAAAPLPPAAAVPEVRASKDPARATASRQTSRSRAWSRRPPGVGRRTHNVLVTSEFQAEEGAVGTPDFVPC